VVICDVVYDPPGHEPDDEAISVCNAGNSPADLGGWTVADNHGAYLIPAGTRLDPGERWTVRGVTFNPGRSPSGLYLANDGDFVQLLDPDGRAVDSRSW
jgi:hypothetical protein